MTTTSEPRDPADRPTELRSTEQRLTKVGVSGAAAVSAIVGVSTALLVFLAGIAVWAVAAGSGLVARGEDLVATVTTDGTYALDGTALLAGWALLAVLWAATATVLGALLAVMVNAACALTGGIRLQMAHRARSRPAPSGLLHAAAAPPRPERAGGTGTVDEEATAA